MSPETNDFVMVFITVGHANEAQEIANTIVHERLAACSSVVSGVKSVYRWEGKICRDEEHLIIAKTRGSLFENLRARVLEFHSYKVPEIVAVPISSGHQPYLDWIADETKA